MMTFDEKLEMYAEKYGRDVFAAIYDIESSLLGFLYSYFLYVRRMIEEDNRIEEYISDLSNAISAECTSDKEYWRAMAVCLSSLYIDGNPFEEGGNSWARMWMEMWMKKNNHI